MSEEIRGITWDLWGQRLSYQQTIQRIIWAGFPIQGGVALIMFAIVMGESGMYQKAWHINVKRNADGTIFKDSQGRMIIKSIDLGFLQNNVEVSPDLPMEMDEIAITAFVNAQFDANPRLAVPKTAAADALDIWKARGFTPWYAYKPGTPEWHVKMKESVKGFADWAIHSFVGPDPDTGKLPVMNYDK